MIRCRPAETVRQLQLGELALAAGGGSNSSYGCDPPTSTRKGVDI